MSAFISADFEFDVPVRFDTDRPEFRLETGPNGADCFVQGRRLAEPSRRFCLTKP